MRIGGNDSPFDVSLQSFYSGRVKKAAPEKNSGLYLRNRTTGEVATNVVGTIDQ